MKADEATEILEAVHSRCSVEDYIHLLNGLIEEAAREGKNSVKLYEVKYKGEDIPEPSPLVADVILRYFEDEGFHIDRHVLYPGIEWDWHDEAKLMRSQRLSLAAVDDRIDNSMCLALNVAQKQIESAKRLGVFVVILLVVLPYCHLLWDVYTSQSPFTKTVDSSQYILRNRESTALPKRSKEVK